MDKKNLLFIFVIIVSFFLARFIGETILVKGTFSLNPKIPEKLRTMLLTPTPGLVPLLTRNPTIGGFDSPTQAPAEQQATVEGLAICLRDKGVVMYGTEDCPNCKIQKSYFGDTFRYIKYIDCDRESDLCKQKNITGYPTWEAPEGKMYKGAIPLGTLAELTGCPVPR